MSATLAVEAAAYCAEALIVTRAEAALAAVGSDIFPWPELAREGRWIRTYADWLADDLEAREDLLAGRIHPTTEFPELASGWPDDALAQAVAKVMRDIEAGTGALIERVGRYCGDEAAAYVSGEKGEQP